MAAHKIILTDVFYNQKVGNSISSTATYVDGELTISWKGTSKTFPAPKGSFALITCEGSFPNVIIMVPPKNPVDKIAWEYGFYRKKRFETREKLIDAAKKLKSYRSLYGCKMPTGRIYNYQNCCFVYRSCMEGQIGVPWGWWVSPAATAEEIEYSIKTALKN